MNTRAILPSPCSAFPLDRSNSLSCARRYTTCSVRTPWSRTCTTPLPQWPASSASVRWGSSSVPVSRSPRVALPAGTSAVPPRMSPHCQQGNPLRAQYRNSSRQPWGIPSHQQGNPLRTQYRSASHGGPSVTCKGIPSGPSTGMPADSHGGPLDQSWWRHPPWKSATGETDGGRGGQWRGAGLTLPAPV